MEKHHYTGKNTREITFPLGGIGSGSIGLGGNGRLMEWEIKNRPDKGTYNGMSHFAVKAEAGGRVIDARVLQGDLLKEYIGQTGMPGYGMGITRDSMAGFPHFEHCDFCGEFPFARLTFTDKHFPAPVAMTAFNPLIPLDEDASSIPAAFFEIEITNPLEEAVTFTAALTVRNMFDKCFNRAFTQDQWKGVHLYQGPIPEDDPAFGELAMAADGGLADDVHIQEYWVHSGWYDPARTYWQEFTQSGPLPERRYEEGYWDHATLQAVKTLQKGETVRFRFVISWNFPNCCNYWDPDKTPEGKDKTWKNYYTKLFRDAVHSAVYSLENWDRLYSRTEAFHQALFSSTLPDEVIEAASANLASLKSSVVLRLENGSLYGWEGAFQTEGACSGTCSHVWAYAYAVPYLFPALDRSIRQNEYTYSVFDNGMLTFRMNLPLGRERVQYRACVDGQMAGVLKSYFDWKFSGDDQWLKTWWPSIRKTLEYAWSPDNEDGWDRNKDGVLEGRQHHTLDMELFGPSSWLQGFYMAALKAAAEMAEYLGEPDKAAEYRELLGKGQAYCEQELFNGRYYFHKLDLKDETLVERYRNCSLDTGDAVQIYWNEERKEIKYQIGEGCEIDQVLAQWHADLSGLGDIFNRDHLKTALEHIFRYNHISCMRNFPNPCRIFALNDEGGTIICSYPEGAYQPFSPIPYAEETMHGFEYQVGAQMIRNGMIQEGMQVIRAVRERYTGEFRSPWNEIECGCNYARSMASYSLIPIISGFSFDLPHKRIGFDPLLWQDGAFSCIWSVGTAWGRMEATKQSVRIRIQEGCLELQSIRLPFLLQKSKPVVTADGMTIPAAYAEADILLDMPVVCTKELAVEG